MKTVFKTVGGQVLGVLMYGLMLLFMILTVMLSPKIASGIYLLTTLIVMMYTTLYTILILKDLVEEDTFNENVKEYIKKASINVFVSYIIGMTIHIILQEVTGISSYDPIETSVFLVSLAYIVPYGVIGLKTYEDTFNKMGMSKDVLKAYIAVVMVILMSIFIITSFTQTAIIISGVLVIIAILLVNLVIKMNKKEQNELTNKEDLEYTEEEK